MTLLDCRQRLSNESPVIRHAGIHPSSMPEKFPQNRLRPCPRAPTQCPHPAFELHLCSAHGRSVFWEEAGTHRETASRRERLHFPDPNSTSSSTTGRLPVVLPPQRWSPCCMTV